MSALAFAFIGALSYAVGALATRRAVIKVADATVGTLISVPIGLPFFILILIAIGEISSIASLPWQSYAWFSAAGILHYVVGRSLSYNCVQLVGANISNVLRRISPLISLILGLSILGEPFTWKLLAGVLLIVGGLIVTGLNPQMLCGKQRLFANIPRKAILLGLGAGLAWGISPILVKMGLESSNSPVAGVFIAYSAATIVLGISLWNQDRRATFADMKKGATGFFLLSGLLSSIAQLMKYIALSMAPASLVVPIFSISPIFVVILSFLFNRKLEVFNAPVIIGTIAVVIGSILLV
ncbi:EamA family transporter [Chloroflexota bacterium]